MTTQPVYKPEEAFDDCLWPVSRDISIRSLHLFPEPFCLRLQDPTIDQVGVSQGISRQSWIRRPPYLSTSELSCPKEWIPEMVSLLMVAILVVTLGGRGMVMAFW
jgi:hypothetical protein